MTLPAVPEPGAPKEPLVSVATITALASAVLVLVVAFGLKLSADQMTALIGFIAVAAPIVVAVVGRMKVFSPATVRAMMVAKK